MMLFSVTLSDPNYKGRGQGHYDPFLISTPTHCNVYPIFVKFVRLTHSNKELLTYLLTYLFTCNHISENG